MTSDFYSHPRYYEIAFSFLDIPREVDLFETCFQRYSKIPVRRVLELACGPGPHMVELGRRGYEYVGLDINPTMLEDARKKAEDLGLPATLVLGDMCHFSLEAPVDFVYVMLGSLFVTSTDNLLEHLEAVARALRPGGLYLLDACIHFAWDQAFIGEEDTWTIEQDGVRVTVSFKRAGPLDRAGQISHDLMIADVHDGDRHLRLVSKERTRLIFPQEFLLLLEKSGAFELVGWWNRWNLDEPIDQAHEINRPITLIRRL